MLKSIRLENFKLHEKTTIDAARMTVFIGPNNSGKSSIFQALLALRQAAARGGEGGFLQPVQRSTTSADQPYLVPGQSIVELGEFGHVLRHGKGEVSIGLSGTTYPRSTLAYDGRADVAFDVHIRNNNLAYHSGQVQGLPCSFRWESVGGRAQQVSVPAQFGNLSIAANFRSVRNFHFLESLGVQGFPPGFPPSSQTDIGSFLAYLARTPVALLVSLHPISPLRGFEEWGYPLPDSAAWNLEQLVLPDRAIAAASMLAYNRDLEERLSARLEELVGIGIEARLLPPKRVIIRARQSGKKGFESLFTNEGSGANQLPFILLPIALAPENESILLSEPEAYLHPKAQSELTGLLLRIADKQNLQFLIETHSEHVLHKLLHAVAKGELAKTDLAIYYFQNKDGVADVTRLKVDERGGVEGGLPGFYDQSLTELTEYLDALKRS